MLSSRLEQNVFLDLWIHKTNFVKILSQNLFCVFRDLKKHSSQQHQQQPHFLYKIYKLQIIHQFNYQSNISITINIKKEGIVVKQWRRTLPLNRGVHFQIRFRGAIILWAKKKNDMFKNYWLQSCANVAIPTNTSARIAQEISSVKYRMELRQSFGIAGLLRTRPFKCSIQIKLNVRTN